MSASVTGVTDVAALIVNWNTRELLAECLEALYATEDLSLQMVVVDNASTDGSSAWVRSQFPEAILLASAENLGFVGGNNRAYALAASGARYLLLINPDAILRPGALSAMTRWMDAHPEAGACGPLLLNSDGTLQPSWNRFPTAVSETLGYHDRRFRSSGRAPALTAAAVRNLPGPERVDWVGGACLMVRRSLVDGPLKGVLLDPDFQMYSEETDLCYRLWRAGWPVYFLPHVEVVHHSGQSSKQAPARTIRLLYRSKLLFFQKHYGPPRTWQLRAGVAVLAALKWAVFGLLGLLPTGRRDTFTQQRARQRAVLEALSIRHEEHVVRS